MDGATLAATGISPEALSWTKVLRRDGFVILRGLVDPELVTQVWRDLAERFEKTPFCVGDFYGGRTKRFGGVLKRSARSAELVAHPLILEIVTQVLKPDCDCLLLNLTQALQIHPGQAAQPPHRDEDMWGGPKGGMEYLVNIMWPFSPYTAENGATLIYPQRETLGPKTSDGGLGAPFVAEMAPGDVLMFLGSTTHCGGANISEEVRTGMIVSYCLGWLKPFENQWLVYPPDVARTFPSELAKLVGYQQHRPNLGNYEGRCPSILLGPEAADYLGAVDDLRPEQVAALRAMRANIPTT